MDDEADRNQIVAEVIQERAAAGAVVERPAQRVLHQTLVVLVRRNLPQFLQPDAEFLRLAVLRSPKRSISTLDSQPRAPSANSVYLPRSSMPRAKPAL